MKTNEEILKEKRKAMAIIIKKAKEYQLKQVLVTYTSEDGEYLGEQLISLDLLHKATKKLNLARQVVKPFSIVSEAVYNHYMQHFTQAEKGNFLDLVVRVDAFGRIKYGDAWIQYCRTPKDFEKILGISYDSLRKSFIPKLIKYDIIRTVIVKKSYGDQEYVSFNPALVSGGGYWDRWSLIIWWDILEEHKLVSLEDLMGVTGFTDKDFEAEYIDENKVLHNIKESSK